MSFQNIFPGSTICDNKGVPYLVLTVERDGKETVKGTCLHGKEIISFLKSTVPVKLTYKEKDRYHKGLLTAHIKYPNGAKESYKLGGYHRLDGPAVVRANGTRKWYQNNKLHRTDGPAIIWDNGNVEYRQKGVLHRTDGPAIIQHNGIRFWCLKGRYYTEEEFNSFQK